jgi:hypothetical protein
MVETETILTSIFIPILIGPLFIFFKELWDRYKLHNLEVKKNYYNENMVLVKDKLALFYWPIYIKLCCLYHLNYNVIEDTQKENPTIETLNVDLSETLSDTPNEEEVEIREKVKKKYKKKQCGYEYFNDEKKLINCKNIVNHHDTYKYCFDCRKIIIQDEVPVKKRKNGKHIFNKPNNLNKLNKLDKLNKLNKLDKEHITINISDDLEWERNTTDSENSSIDETHMAILKILNNNSSNSSMSDITGDGVGVVNTLPTKIIQMDRLLVDNLDKKIIELYLDVKNIILNNIAVGQPKSKLGRELTKFIRFVEMEDIVFDANKKKKYNKFYDSKNLGVVNNIRKLLEIIEVDLFVLQKEYNRMIKNYY